MGNHRTEPPMMVMGEATSSPQMGCTHSFFWSESKYVHWKSKFTIQNKTTHDGTIGSNTPLIVSQSSSSNLPFCSLNFFLLLLFLLPTSHPRVFPTEDEQVADRSLLGASAVHKWGSSRSTVEFNVSRITMYRGGHQ